MRRKLISIRTREKVLSQPTFEQLSQRIVDNLWEYDVSKILHSWRWTVLSYLWHCIYQSLSGMFVINLFLSNYFIFRRILSVSNVLQAGYSRFFSMKSIHFISKKNIINGTYLKHKQDINQQIKNSVNEFPVYWPVTYSYAL